MNPMQNPGTTKSSSKPPKKEKAKKKKTLVENEAQIAKAPSDFSFAVAKIAVSQICQSVGFKRTQLYALETLTTVATKYLQAIAKSAASFSNSSNRSHSNLFDLINAVHDICSVQGFPTASETHKSSQIPLWLPDFPAESLYKNRNQVIKERKHGEKLWEHSVPMEICGGNVEENEEVLRIKEFCRKEVKDGRMELAKERGKLKFKIGKDKDQAFGLGVNMMNGVCKGGKRVCWNHKKMNDCMFEDKEDERCAFKRKTEYG